MEGSLARADGPSGIVAAWYEDPTTRYAHGVLGDAVEAGTLAAQLDDFPNCITGRITLPETEVFEDLAPRLADLDGDGRAEIIVVQSHRDLGARLVVYGLTPDGQNLRLLAATPNIGQRNRWLAPIGAADLDGDGRVEIAYIDRPHLARTLRVWRYAGGTLTAIAAATGLTNHRTCTLHPARALYRSHTCPAASARLSQPYLCRSHPRQRGRDHPPQRLGAPHRRDHGGVLFIDLRDHYGMTQVLCDPDSPVFAEVEKVRANGASASTAR
jgi:hypothetical protein